MGSLEDEIKQSVFRNNVRKSILNIMYTSNYLRDSHAPIFKEFGILQQHYNVLRIIKGKKGESVTPGQIIKVMLDKGRDLTRLVDKLVKIGYLVRKPCDVNRRKVNINITKKGIEITDIIETQINDWANANMGISEEEAITLNCLLDKMRGDH